MRKHGMHAIKSSGISGRLYTTMASPRWQLKFYHPGIRKRQRVSLGTESLELAKVKAKAILDDIATKGVAALKDHAMRATALPVGKAIDHYLQTSKIASRHANVNCLLIVLRTALGGDNDAVRAKPLSVISPSLVAKYKAKFQGSAYSVRTNLASARAIFAHPLDWEGFELPDSIAKFAAATKGMKAPVSTFIRIAPETLEKMEASSKAIGGATRRAFLLTRYLGMTPKEVAYCRKGWIEDRGDRHVMVLVERPSEELTLKTGHKRGRVMALPTWMVPELMAAEDFMVTGRTAGTRMKFMERNFNLWVREFLPDRRSAAYELRRQAGSDMLNATGKISVVQHMLGHASPQTTARFYAVYDREVDVASVWDVPIT
jgi:integrase